MSKKQEGASLKPAPQSPITTETTSTSQQHTPQPHQSLHSQSEEQKAGKPDQVSDTTSPSTPDDPRARPRQVIAVSASKGPAAFFNLARKFLVTDEYCDLSALEGAIVSAADAAHLLERSQLATIVRVQTSYVTVEPKRRKQQQHHQQQQQAQHGDTSASPGVASAAAEQQHSRSRGPTREQRRARIVITVKRTESYKQWLDENPLQAVIAGDEGDQAVVGTQP